MYLTLGRCTVVAPCTIEASAPAASNPVAPKAYMLATIEWYGSPTMTPAKPLFCDQRSHTSPAWCAWLNMDCAMSAASLGASNASSCASDR